MSFQKPCRDIGAPFILVNSLSCSVSKTIAGRTFTRYSATDFTAAGYKAKTNTITYTDRKDLIHELFHMASTKKGSNTNGITVNEIIDREQVKLNA